MRVRWYGQSTFLLSGGRTVFIDPFGDMGEALVARGLDFRYPRSRARPQRCCSSPMSIATTTWSTWWWRASRDPLDGGAIRVSDR